MEDLIASPETYILDEAEWSLESCNLDSILSNTEYPCLLRLVGNDYSDKHVLIEQNDVLVLEDCLFKYALKARFCKCDDRHRYITSFSESEDVFLPLGCTQRGVIRPLVVDFDQEIFHCPNDLGINFPRFVRLRSDIRLVGGPNDHNTTYIIPKDEILEVLRWEYKSEIVDTKLEVFDEEEGSLEPLYNVYTNWTGDTALRGLKNMRLICSWNDKLLALSSNTEIELEGVLDQTQYTILDIFERFLSPQGFIFVDREDADQIRETSYQGCYLLKEICPVLILNGYHIKWHGRSPIEIFRLPLVTEDADLLRFSVGKLTSGSPLDAGWRDDTTFSIQRSQSLSSSFKDTSEIRRRRRMTFHSSISGNYNMQEWKDKDSKIGGGPVCYEIQNSTFSVFIFIRRCLDGLTQGSQTCGP